MQIVRSVFEVTQILKRAIQSNDELARVVVRGEISNFSRPASGHCYFTLKDDRARLRVVMFAGKARFLRFALRDGMSVIVEGGIDVFERSGDYQLYAEAIQPDGLGALYLAFEQLKERLQKEGLFDPSRKRPLPSFPERIALVTSSTGAAVRDMITTLGRRYPLGRVLVVPVPVQGDESPEQIAQGIRLVSRTRLADVMIVGRGGGSFEELFAFNTEVVARAIATAAIPVVSAVGHETDTTIADFVADVRAATPTAAAELVSSDLREVEMRVSYLRSKVAQGMDALLRRLRDRIDKLAADRVLSDPMRMVTPYHEYLDIAARQLESALKQRVSVGARALSSIEVRLARVSPAQKIALLRMQTEALSNRHRQAMERCMQESETALQRGIERLELLNPLAVMKRGYAVAFHTVSGRAVTSIDQVQPGDSMRLEITDGWLDCQVWGVHGEDDQT